MDTLRVVVKERMTAATEEILCVIERIIGEYEKDVLYYKQELVRHCTQRNPEIRIRRIDDHHHLSVYREDISSKYHNCGQRLEAEERPIQCSPSNEEGIYAQFLFKKEEDLGFELSQDDVGVQCAEDADHQFSSFLLSAVPGDHNHDRNVSSLTISEGQEDGSRYRIFSPSTFMDVATPTQPAAEESVEFVPDSGCHVLSSEDEGDEEEEDCNIPGQGDQRHKASMEDLKKVQEPRHEEGRRAVKVVTLRVRVLVNPHVRVLSKYVYAESRLQTLKVPYGLGEAKFLRLLRSIFPELADKPFDVLRSDNRMQLIPVQPDRLSPGEILSSLRRSALYIRLKEGNGPQNKPTPTPCGGDPAPSTSAEDGQEEWKPDGEGGQSGSDREGKGGESDSDWEESKGRASKADLPAPKPRIEEEDGTSPGQEDQQCIVSSRRKVSRGSLRRVQEPRPRAGGHGVETVTLRVRVLVNPHIRALSKYMCSEYHFQKLKVPCGLGEAKFLKLLRSSFPELADKPFDFLKLDVGRKLIPVQPDRLSPGEILSSLGRSALYIRLKDSHHKPTPAPCGGDTAPSTSAEDGQEEWKPDSEEGQSGSDTECNGGESDSDWVESEGRASKADLPAPKPRIDKQQRAPKATRKSRFKFPAAKQVVSFPCKVCKMSFPSLPSVLKHVLQHADDSECVCGFCGEHLKPEDSLADHLQTHKMHKAYECGTCHKRFSCNANLKYHSWTHTGERPYPCNKCGKSFRSCSTFLRHKHTHIEEKTHQCQECGKRYGHVNQLKVHLKSHSMPDVYVCDICGLKFTSNQRFLYHTRVHSGERPYSCTECGKKFRDGGTMARHAKTHTGLKPFDCSECGKSFSSCFARAIHMRSHSNEKPFICDFCGKGFRRFEHLKVHQRTHTGEKPYKCSVCGKAFTQSHCLKDHSKTHK